MNSTEIAMLIALIILIILSSFFSSAETAFTTVSEFKLKAMIDENHKKAKKAKLVCKIIDDKPKMLSAILIGNNLVNIIASSMATLLAQSILGENAYAISIATGLLTLIILIFGEITPKNLATMYALNFSLFYCNIIYCTMVVLTPVIYIINFLSQSLLRVFGIKQDVHKNAFTENEIRTIVKVSHEEGVIEREERQMINNVFDFGDCVASDVMVPKVDITMADINSTYDELISIFRQEKYTRIPIYQDSTDNVVGTINMKDLLLYNPEDIFDVRNYLRSAFYTYESKKVSELMMEMRNTSVNIVIVLDEYGITSGLITLEDLLEEIVGEIHDEYDAVEDRPFKEISPNKYLVDGQYKILDLNDNLNLKLHSDEYDSIGGLIIEKLNRFPVVGDVVDLPDIQIKVLEMIKKRVEKVEITKKTSKKDTKVNED